MKRAIRPRRRASVQRLARLGEAALDQGAGAAADQVAGRGGRHGRQARARASTTFSGADQVGRGVDQRAVEVEGDGGAGEGRGGAAASAEVGIGGGFRLNRRDATPAAARCNRRHSRSLDGRPAASRSRAAVILAAGQGTRMRSPPAQGAAQGRRPRPARPRHRRGARARAASGSWWWSARHAPAVGGARRQRGSARARPRCRTRRSAPATPCWRPRPRWPASTATCVVTYADAPLLDADAARRRCSRRARAGADLAVLGFEAADPGAYGRLVLGADGRPGADRRGQGRLARGAGDHRLQFRRAGRAGDAAVRPAGRGRATTTPRANTT